MGGARSTRTGTGARAAVSISTGVTSSGGDWLIHLPPPPPRHPSLGQPVSTLYQSWGGVGRSTSALRPSSSAAVPRIGGALVRRTPNPLKRAWIRLAAASRSPALLKRSKTRPSRTRRVMSLPSLTMRARKPRYRFCKITAASDSVLAAAACFPSTDFETDLVLLACVRGDSFPLVHLYADRSIPLQQPARVTPSWLVRRTADLRVRFGTPTGRRRHRF